MSKGLERNQNVVRVPLGLAERDEGLSVVMGNLPRTRLTEPFFLDSLELRFGIARVDQKRPDVQDVLVRPLHFDPADPRISYVPVERMIEEHESTPWQASPCFIFHMSRCGSTLITQMLSSVERFYVLSEPTIISEILNPGLRIGQATRDQLLRASILALQVHLPGYDHVVYKFRSWNSLLISSFVSLFPEVPWAFVHRSGIEVLESVLRDPPGWLRSRRARAGFFCTYLQQSTIELEELLDGEYVARMLGAFCTQAFEHRTDRSLFVEYEQISRGLPDLLDEPWQLGLTRTERAAMLSTTDFYSKDPLGKRRFASDSLQKQRAVTAEHRLHATEHVESVRVRLRSWHE